jgi:hypothetical protein
MTLKIGSLYCWISRHFYPIYEDFRKSIDPTQYNILNENDIFLVIKYAKVKGRDCYQILHKDEVGWIVDPDPKSIKELSDDINSR